MSNKKMQHVNTDLTPQSGDRRESALASPVHAESHKKALRTLAARAVSRRGDGSLKPFELSDTAWKQIDDLLGRADARATTRSYAAARRLFMGWWICTYARPFELPVPPEAIAQFIADFSTGAQDTRGHDADWVDRQLVDAGLKRAVGPIRYNTLRQRVAAVARWHTDADLASPFSHPLVSRSLKGAKDIADEHGTLQPRRRNGIAREAMQQLLETCDATSDGIRDRALLLFAWGTGGRRPSEVAAASFKHLKANDDGSYTYRLFRSKTMKAGAKPVDLPLAGVVAEAMRGWIAHLQAAKAETDSGPIFRTFRGLNAGGPMSARAIGQVIERRCRAAGMEGNFGGHSARRGWVTQAWNDGLNPADIMALSTHTSLSSAMVYNEAAQPADNPAARLMEGR